MRKTEHHITEAYDNMLEEKYKSKDFARLPKSYMTAQPNNLGDEHIKLYRHRPNSGHIGG
jgi:hypothetical protein